MKWGTEDDRLYINFFDLNMLSYMTLQFWIADNTGIISSDAEPLRIQ
jgi:hypothetical protein